MNARRRWSPKLLGGAAMALLGLLIFMAFFAFGASRGVDQAQDDPEPGAVSAGEVIKDPLMVVVLGVDKRTGDRGRSDTIMVASVDPKTKHAGLLSVPRDIWTEVPGRGYTKLNHAYAYGGPELAVETVSLLLDLPLQHYVVVDFKGFEAIVDAVGGVEIEVEKRLYYHDPYQDLLIDLQPGLQRLNGEKALHYARFRNDAAGDLGRVERQQKFVKALAKEVASPRNILKLPALINAAFDAIETNISLRDSLAYANSARTLAGVEIETGTVPGTGMRLGGVSYIKPDLPAARALAYEVLLGKEPPAEYLAKANQDQERLEAALARARASEPKRPVESPPAQKQDEDAPVPPAEEPGEPADPAPDQPAGPELPLEPETPEQPRDEEDPGAPGDYPDDGGEPGTPGDETNNGAVPGTPVEDDPNGQPSPSPGPGPEAEPAGENDGSV